MFHFSRFGLAFSLASGREAQVLVELGSVSFFLSSKELSCAPNVSTHSSSALRRILVYRGLDATIVHPGSLPCVAQNIYRNGTLLSVSTIKFAVFRT